MVVVLPVIAIGLIVGAVALAIPLLPLLAVGVLLWLLVRSTRSTAIAR